MFPTPPGDTFVTVKTTPRPGVIEVGDPHTLSPFTLVDDAPRFPQLESEGPVRYLAISGARDDGFWGVIGALWLSRDGERGGFLVNPSAPWRGSEMVRSYASALRRGFTPESIYRYWRDEVRRGSYGVDAERDAESLLLLNELVAAL